MDTTDFQVAFGQVYKEHYGRLLAALLSIFRLKDIAIMEDILQDSFLVAYKKWQKEGIPEKPFYWLKKVSKNRVLNHLSRNPRHLPFDYYAQNEDMMDSKMDTFFLDDEIKDNQLRLLFACCNPGLSPKAQVVFTLKTVAGLSIQEIGAGLGSTVEAVGKLWRRTKQKIREENIALSTPYQFQSTERLEAVHHVVYLIFNEGYSATTGDSLIKRELCLDAIRLLKLITEHEKIADVDTYALLAMMLFNVSRFDSRLGPDGMPITLEKQNRKLWDQDLIALGFHFFKRVRKTTVVSRWVVEATIASLHAKAEHWKDTPWEQIAKLYGGLHGQHPQNPFIELNYLLARYHVDGAAEVRPRLDKLAGNKALAENHLLYAALGKIYSELGEVQKSKEYYQKAKDCTKVDAEQRFIQEQINNTPDHDTI